MKFKLIEDIGLIAAGIVVILVFIRHHRKKRELERSMIVGNMSAKK